MVEPCAVPYKPSTNIEESGNRLGVGIGRNKSMVQVSFSGKTSASKTKGQAPSFFPSSFLHPRHPILCVLLSYWRNQPTIDCDRSLSQSRGVTGL